MSSKPHSVFISYARSTSRLYAEALHLELGGAAGLAFLDTADIEMRQQFPSEIAQALLNASVLVAFVDATYFQRWYCLREFEIALSPFQKLVRDGASEEDRRRALLHLVIARPESGGVEALNLLPPAIRLMNWPRASDTKTLAATIRAQLNDVEFPIQEHLRSLFGSDIAKSVNNRFLQQAALPQPANLRGSSTPIYPIELPPSLFEGLKGRADDLWRLHYTLYTMGAGGAALAGALEAGGGFGKTRLALEYFHRFGPLYYPGGLFWLKADVEDEELER